MENLAKQSWQKVPDLSISPLNVVWWTKFSHTGDFPNLITPRSWLRILKNKKIFNRMIGLSKIINLHGLALPIDRKSQPGTVFQPILACEVQPSSIAPDSNDPYIALSFFYYWRNFLLVKDFSCDFPSNWQFFQISSISFL